MFAKTFLLLLLLPYLISTEPLELTDTTWKNMLNGQWMVEFYATWCSACQYFKPTWKDFSYAMSSKNIKVAAIDIDQYPSLSNRFRISSLPTIFYVRDGIFREYNGERSLHALQNYIENEDWQKTEPLSSYTAPNSYLMSLNSMALELSVVLKNAYTLLHDQHGLPTWFIYTILGIAIITLGVFVGFITVLIVDNGIAALSYIYMNAARKNKRELVETDAEKVLKSKKQTNKTGTSSTTQQTEVKNDTSELNKSDSSDDELNISDVAQTKDDLEEETTTDQIVRQRRVEK
ncbi:unnamed protein product [Rotaria sordida]|uniref:Thioredoxin domain-containing protein n=1 Tax=Rotaria sordida TaxID=392033 RepID=A0A818UY66_9BILA|nr:unnamed protein product [Rotaria sordida]